MDLRDPTNFDFEAFIRHYWQRYRGRVIAAGIVLLLLLWGLWTAFYTVAPEGQAVVKRFGGVVRTTGPGLHMKWPYGIESATFVPTKRVLKEEFGFRTTEAARRSQSEKRGAQEEVSLMLTGDLNVIDVEWVVQYQIRDPDAWLHQVREPRDTIRDVSEAVMRRIVGNELGSAALTEARAQIADDVKAQMQLILDDGKPGGPDYNLGIHIGAVEMQDVTPPDPVKPAFNEVNKARQEKERLKNEAERYRNQVIPKARGQADRSIAEAEGYEAQRVNRAKGEASRFGALLSKYRAAPQVTRRRLHLEMIDQVLPKLGRVYVIEPTGQQPLPLLNLDRDGKRDTTQKGGRP